MCHASYEGVATKLRNALIAIEGYDAMSRDGAAIPIDDMIVTMGEITYAADLFTDMMHGEAIAAKDKGEAVQSELDRCRVGCKDLGGI